MKKAIYFLAFLMLPIFSFSQETTVTVSPTWGESFHYANQTGQIGWTVVSIICLIALVAMLVLGSDRLPDFVAKKFVLFCIVLAVVFLSALLVKPGNIRWNNDKKVDTTYLEKVGRKHIIDSCFQNNLLIGAAVKK